MPITRQSVQGFSDSLNKAMALIIQSLQNRDYQRQVEQAKQSAFGPPVDVGAAPVDFGRNPTPDNATLPTAVGQTPGGPMTPAFVQNQIPFRDTNVQTQGGGGQEAFMRALANMTMNPAAQQTLQQQLALRPQPQVIPQGSMYGTRDQFSNQFTPEIVNPRDTTSTQKNAVAVPTGNTKTENGIIKEEWIPSDPNTMKPLPGAQPQWRMKTQASAYGLGSGISADDPKEIAKAIMEGKQPPDMKGLYRFGAPVKAELARRGFDLSTANRDWTSIQKYLASLNGPQQLRLRQSVELASEMLPNIKSLYDQLKQFSPQATGFKVWNRAALAAARNMPGPAGAIASNLEAQIADFVSDLATVYRGGNVSTDEALQLAAKNLQTDWNPETFNMAIKQIERNLTMRRNSIRNAGPLGITEGSPYTPPVNIGNQPQQTTQQKYSRTATNPQNGQKVGYNEQTGQWEPIQ